MMAFWKSLIGRCAALDLFEIALGYRFCWKGPGCHRHGSLDSPWLRMQGRALTGALLNYAGSSRDAITRVSGLAILQRFF